MIDPEIAKEVLRNQIELNLEYAEKLILNCANIDRRSKFLSAAKDAKKELETLQKIDLDTWLLTLELLNKLKELAEKDPEFNFDFE